METRAHHVLIGLFTVLTAAAALLFAIWMSYDAGQRDYLPYRILFERNVSGKALDGHFVDIGLLTFALDDESRT